MNLDDVQEVLLLILMVVYIIVGVVYVIRHR